MKRALSFGLFTLACLAICAMRSPQALVPVRATEPVSEDSDDPAIWIHPSDASNSRIIGTDKVEKAGGLYVFDLQGKIVQHIPGLDRPNNVDVVQNVSFGGRVIDLAVCTERVRERLGIYEIDRESGALKSVSGKTGVFPDRRGEEKAPMGIALYRKSADEVFAIVSPKTGSINNYLEMYRLVPGNGKQVDVQYVRSFGRFSGMKIEDDELTGEIEAVAVDDEAGVVYYSDELSGLRRYKIETDPAVPMVEMDHFGQDGYEGDREGLAVVRHEGRTLLLSSDQVENGSRIHVYDVTEAPKRLAIIETPSDSTDGLEATTANLGSEFDKGLLVMMNSKDRNFLLFNLSEVLSARD